MNANGILNGYIEAECDWATYFLYSDLNKGTSRNFEVTAGGILRKQLNNFFIDTTYSINLENCKTYLKNSIELQFSKKIYSDSFCSECEHLEDVILVLEIETYKKEKEIIDIIAKLNHSYYFINYTVNSIIENSEILYVG